LHGLCRTVEIEYLNVPCIGASLIDGDLLQHVDDFIHGVQRFLDFAQVAQRGRGEVQVRIVEEQLEVAPGDGEGLLQFVCDSTGELDDDAIPLELG